MGRWFEISKYPNSFQDGECGSAFYTLQDDNIVGVNNTELGPDNTAHTAIGQARSDPKSDIPGHLQVRFSKWSPWGKYWVLDTDYNNYSVVYSCSNYLYVSKIEFLWILGRKSSIPTETRTAIEEMLKGYKIKVDKLVDTQQDEEKCGGFHQNL